MKKTLFLISLAALGLTACTNDETLSEIDSQEQKNISFRPAMGTRATETTNANLNEINVTAFEGDTPFFEKLDFIKGSDNFFTSTPVYNWPGDDTELNFWAFSPLTLKDQVTMTANSKVLTDFSPATDIAQQVDFITANATGKKSANEASGVPLTFDHQLSQIEVLAKTDNTAYVYKVTGVRVGAPVSKGTFDFTTKAWTLGTGNDIYTDTYATPVQLGSTAQSVMGAGGNLMLIPQQLTAWDVKNDAENSANGAYLSIKLQINTVAGAQMYPFPSDGDCQWAAIPIDTNWEAGKKYTYTLDLTNGAGYVDPHDPDPSTPVLGGPIKFTVDVTDWVPSDQPIPMNTDKTE